LSETRREKHIQKRIYEKQSKKKGLKERKNPNEWLRARVSRGIPWKSRIFTPFYCRLVKLEG
jgi:hypothetical protein